MSETHTCCDAPVGWEKHRTQTRAHTRFYFSHTLDLKKLFDFILKSQNMVRTRSDLQSLVDVGRFPDRLHDAKLQPVGDLQMWACVLENISRLS